MVSQLPKPWTIEQFAEWEARQPERYEYIDGVITAMTGGTNAHTRIRDRLIIALDAALRGKPCEVLGEGPKVFAGQSLHYPDVIVTCSEVMPFDDSVREPAVVVEVLSPSTEERTRSAKWLSYREIPSLRHYVLVAQDRRLVEVYSRSDEGWLLTLFAPPLETVRLPAIDAEVSLDEIYEGSGT